MNQQLHQNNSAPVIEAIERLTKTNGAKLVDLPGSGGHKVWQRPEGTVESIKKLIDEYAPLPDRVKGTVALHDLTSFLQECERWKNPSLTVYVNAPCTVEHPATITAVIDDLNVEAPKWREHRLVYAPKLSPRLMAWLGAARGMGQEAFAEFIENHLTDVRGRASLVELAKAKSDDAPNLEPLLEAAQMLGLHLGTQAELLTLSRGLEATVTQKVKGRPNLQNGSAIFAFEESVDTGAVSVPGGFVIEVPVFNGSTNVFILARLRYQIKDGFVTWKVLLHDLDGVCREAVNDLRSEIAAPGHRVVLGTP